MTSGIKLTITLDGTLEKKTLMSEVRKKVIQVESNIISSGNYLGTTIKEIESMIVKKLKRDYDGMHR